MTVQDLNRDQLAELKCSYYFELVNEGIFGEIIGRDYDEPSYYDLAFVDDIVSDESTDIARDICKMVKENDIVFDDKYNM